MSKHKTILVLSLAAALLMIGVGMIVALLPQRVYAVTGTLESVSLIASIFALAYLLTQLPVGLLSDLLGSKPLLIFGYCLCGCSGLIFFNAQSANDIYLGRLVQGVGEAPIWALGPAVLSLAYPRNKGLAIGIYNAAVHVGLTLGPLLGLLLTPAGQSNLPFLIFAALSMTGAALIFALLSTGRTTDRANLEPRAGLSDFIVLLSDRRILSLLLGIVLYGASYGSFLSVLPITLINTHAFEAQATSLLFVAFYAGISLSQLAAGPLSDRYGHDRFILGGFLLAALNFAVFPLFPGALVYGPLALASLGLGAFCVASLAKLNDSVPPGLRGTVSGSYYLAWALGYVLGPLAIGYLSGFAPSLGYILLAAALFLQTVVIRVAR